MRKKLAKRAWQRMLSGRRLDLLDPTPIDIEIEDIAHGLSFLARWNGQTIGAYGYSVAEHSLLVETIFARLHPNSDPKWKLAALLHDAPEYVIGDLISPVKTSVGSGYSDLEDRLLHAIHLRFGLPAMLPKMVKIQIKKADKRSAWLEATKIAGFSLSESNKLFGTPKENWMPDLDILLENPLKTKKRFLKKHPELYNQMNK